MAAPIVQIRPVSLDYTGASVATGASIDTIRRAVNAGDLEVHYPTVNGRAISKPLILTADLHAWVERGKTERAS